MRKTGSWLRRFFRFMLVYQKNKEMEVLRIDLEKRSSSDLVGKSL